MHTYVYAHVYVKHHMYAFDAYACLMQCRQSHATYYTDHGPKGQPSATTIPPVSYFI